jgi:hypothetical protein
MKLSQMTSEIIDIINEKYPHNKCFDIKQIKEFCKLCKKNNSSDITLSDIDFSTPDIKKIKLNKKVEAKINTPEFQKVYCLFVKIIYSCLMLHVEIFDKDDDIVTMKNNYKLMHSIEHRRRKYVSEHMEILNKEKKKSSINITVYEKYVSDYILKIKIINKLTGWLSILEKNDNLFSLILPYFYVYREFIEEYSG